MDLKSILKDAETAITDADDERRLDEVRVRYLGKKGELTTLLKGLGSLSTGRASQGGRRDQRCQGGGAPTWINERKAALASEQLAQLALGPRRGTDGRDTCRVRKRGRRAVCIR